MQDLTTERRPVVPATRAPWTRATATNGAPVAARSAPDLGRDRHDVLLLLMLAVATILVHPVGEMLRRPYWLDEAWVAALTKAPWDQFAQMSSSAPVGFVALLHLVPDAGGQRARMVVLAFAVLTVVATYLVVRSLAWRRMLHARVAATATALVVMLAPVSLARNDLKQYTCDAFVAVLLLGMGARAERLGSRGSLAALCVAAALALPFSSTALFVTVAVVFALFAAACIDRAWRRAWEIAVAGAVAGAALAGWYVVAVEPNVNERLREFWSNQYLHGSLGHSLALVGKRLDRLDHGLAMPALVFAGLFVLGVVVLVRLRANALAIAVPALWVEMFVMARAERYPFLDQRTSHFLLVPSLLVVALGAVGLIAVVARAGPSRHSGIGKGLALVVAAALATLFAVGVQPYVRNLNIIDEDVRSQTHAVAERGRPGDVTLVGWAADFGFAYYWPRGQLQFTGDERNGQSYGVEVEPSDAIYVRSRDYTDVLEAVQRAIARLRAAPEGSRLYIVRTHVGRDEAVTWNRAFAAVQVTPLEDVVGVEPLLVLERSALDTKEG